MKGLSNQVKNTRLLLVSSFLLLYSSLFASNNPPVLYPRDCFLNEKTRIEAYAAYTYWLGYQIGLEYGFNRGGEESIGEYFEPEFEACSGFKVGLDANSFHDRWHVSLNYTWFNNDPKANEIEENPGSLIPIFSGYTIDGGTSKFFNQFNRIDGKVSKEFFLGNYIFLSPGFGFLGVFDQENLHLNLDVEVLSSPSTETIRLHQRWWGVGPYIATGAKYFFQKALGLYIGAGTSLLLSKHDLSYFDSYKSDDGLSSGTIRNNANRFYSVEPMVELSLGFFYTTCKEKIDFSLEIGWETQSYFSHLGFRPFESDYQYNRNNYSLQGLTLGATIGY